MVASSPTRPAPAGTTRRLLRPIPARRRSTSPTATGLTAEVTSVPEGQRPGNSLHPVLAGDGCSIVVVSEIALDVFRDSMHRRPLGRVPTSAPSAGGTLGGWELVSTRSDGSGLARDDVSTLDAPTVSRSGTLIAYTHPATQLIEAGEVTSVSLVNLEVPLTDPARSAAVAGMPISTPDTQFVHAGLDQPTISGDGRFVAYRSDAASNDAVPGWGNRVTPGGPATRQIYVCGTANEIDPFLAVRLVSVFAPMVNPPPSEMDPALSRDGRVGRVDPRTSASCRLCFPRVAMAVPARCSASTVTPTRTGSTTR